MLIKLLQAKVDTNPAVRKLMVAAVIAGGNVTVPTGKTVGATFKTLPLCTSAKLSRCVIAYSSFPSEPPASANFGRPGRGISLNTGQTATTGVQVACVNPAAIGGGTASLQTFWPVSMPLPIPLYGTARARCEDPVAVLPQAVHRNLRKRGRCDLVTGDCRRCERRHSTGCK